jgi:hypothetical protein
MEVAYQHVWPGGFIPWEFQQHAKIRGFTHPLLFVAFYALLKHTGMDSTWMVANGPRLVQALFAGVGDYYLYRLGFRLLGGRAGARWTLFLSCVNWFSFFCLTRTLSNSMECSLGLVAFYYWPDTSGWMLSETASTEETARYERSRRIALVLAAIIFVIRPTNSLIWLLLGVIHLSIAPTVASRIKLLRDVAIIGVCTLVLSSFVDTVCYAALVKYNWSQRRNEDRFAVPDLVSYIDVIFSLLSEWQPRNWVVVSFNFLRLNSGTDLAKLYGVHPWHWYVTEGLPTNLGTMTPIFVWAVWRFVKRRSDNAPTKREAGTSENVDARRSLWILLACLVWCIFTYSLNAHKEFRFILVVTPVAFLIIAWVIVGLEVGRGTKREESEDSPTNESLGRDFPNRDGLRQRTKSSPTAGAASISSFSSTAATRSSSARSSRATVSLVLFLVVTNVLMAGYFCFVHQSGPRRVFARLNEIVEMDQQRCDASDSFPKADCLAAHRVFFLMNCHTMPLSTFAHHPLSRNTTRLSMFFLDCAPLFIDGHLFAHGANPCSPSALFRSGAVVRQLLQDRENHTLDRALQMLTTMEWTITRRPWENPWRQCMQQHLGLDQKEADAKTINNEHRPQRIISGYKRWSYDFVPLVRTTVILTDEYFTRYGEFFPTPEWSREEFFHSHLDDIKSFTMLTRVQVEESDI